MSPLFKPSKRSSSTDALTAPDGQLPAEFQAGPVPDKLSIWPMDDGRYGLDATFQGPSGYDRADTHRQALTAQGIPFSFRQNLTDGWTLRFGPLTAYEIAQALGAFVY